jgi:hypothetical protein
MFALETIDKLGDLSILLHQSSLDLVSEGSILPEVEEMVLHHVSTSQHLLNDVGHDLVWVV